MIDTMIIPTKPFFVCENEALKKKVEQLEREANWLAHKVSHYYQDIDKRCNDGKMTDSRTGYEYWREAARKAVENDN